MLSRTFVIALSTVAAPLAFPAPSFAQEAAAPTAAQMTSAQIAAFNQAVTDFTAGQTAQQAGDNNVAAAKYEAALPAIRTAVQIDPGKIENVNFLANALYADAAAQGALGRMDKVIALYSESAPYWRQIVEAKPADAANRNIFAGILIQLGNQKLAGQDKAGADPLYKEALALARTSVAENGTDAVSRNILLSALIGASQTANDPALTNEALSLGKAMLSDGTIDAMNKPSVQAMTGKKAGWFLARGGKAFAFLPPDGSSGKAADDLVGVQHPPWAQQPDKLRQHMAGERETALAAADLAPGGDVILAHIIGAMDDDGAHFRIVVLRIEPRQPHGAPMLAFVNLTRLERT